MLNQFLNSEYGASLVEYAVALIIVTIIGGGGVIAIGSNSGTLATNASGTVDNAVLATSQVD